ncbi:MAG: MoxR family ATPase [SAR324 cluster bacterium]|nr:MoxR family ATPase [SAR324 cluster bacterium]
MSLESEVDAVKVEFAKIKKELRKKIVGNDEIIEGILTCLLCNGHALLEGPPGLGKTSIIKSLGEALHLEFSRIQFTPDLMPADIIGTRIVMEDDSGKRFFEFQKGPMFANIVLADEINRATPKTQSALLESMQEGRATVGRDEHQLPHPFLVLATQNPIEMEGTYPLPEAQLDRFFFKLIMKPPTREELLEIIDMTTAEEPEAIQPVVSEEHIHELQRLVRMVPVASAVKNYALRLVMATHPKAEEAIDETRKYVRYGASPRALQSMILSAKTRALLHGRVSASFEDIRQATPACLRHRVILNFEGEAEGITTEDINRFLLESIQPE